MNNTTSSSHITGTDRVLLEVALTAAIVCFIAYVICSCLLRTSSIPRLFSSAEEHGGDSIHVVVQCGGLDAATISTFPMYTYARIKGADPAAATSCCAICLGDFKDGETIRVMPECCHVFHRSCIDPWLMRVSMCPLCRHNPLPAAAER